MRLSEQDTNKLWESNGFFAAEPPDSWTAVCNDLVIIGTGAVFESFLVRLDSDFELLRQVFKLGLVLV